MYWVGRPSMMTWTRSSPRRLPGSVICRRCARPASARRQDLAPRCLVGPGNQGITRVQLTFREPSSAKRFQALQALAAVALAILFCLDLVLPAAAQEDFKTFVESLWPEARDRFGVSRKTFDAAVSG